MSRHSNTQRFFFCPVLTHRVFAGIAYGRLKVNTSNSLPFKYKTFHVLFIWWLVWWRFYHNDVLGESGQTSRASTRRISLRLLNINSCHIYLSVCCAIWCFHCVCRGNKLTLFCRRQTCKAESSFERLFRSFHDLGKCLFSPVRSTLAQENTLS